ncbi:MAG: SRPBCC family protein [Phycisphaerales bacterium]|nr:SRPBCC family protein [Phycisphaerales bacterium]
MKAAPESTLAITRIDRGWRLAATQWLPASLERVFDFFADAHNLEVITPPWLRFEVLTPRPIDLHSGTLIDYRLRVRGLPLRWRSRIDGWDPPHRFTDAMIRGPYRFWRHTHTFAARDGGTLASDAVDYGVPGGALVHRLFVGPDVRRIFTYRQQKLRDLFASARPVT